MVSNSQGRVRVGIIGCGPGAAGRGGVSLMHTKRLMAIPEAKIVAFADVVKERALKRKEEFFPRNNDVFVFTDYKEMINKIDLDAVEIITPHTLHFSQCLYALEAGLNVLVEKPMTTEVSHARKLIEIAKAKKKVLLVSYQRHYLPIFRYAKQVIEKGEIGEIKLVSAFLAQGWRRMVEGQWRVDPALSGGGELMDSGSHLVDAILWLTNLKPREVMAFVDNADLKVDVFSSFSIKFENGALASVAICGDMPARGMREGLAIWGTKGALYFQEGKLFHQFSNGDVKEPCCLPAPSDPDTNFVRAILGKERNESPGECGLKVAELTSAIYKSAREGSKVVI